MTLEIETLKTKVPGWYTSLRPTTNKRERGGERQRERERERERERREKDKKIDLDT
jgi:hypothetical protein